MQLLSTRPSRRRYARARRKRGGDVVVHERIRGWKRLRYHAEQRRLWDSTARVCVIAAGRRSGKTEIGKRKGVKTACRHHVTDDGWYVFGAPTHLQAKRIFWTDVKKLCPPSFVDSISESELTVRLINGAEITVLGLDKPERVEGKPLDGIVVTEAANIKADTWTEHIYPMLMERDGWAWLEGAPEGRSNHLYDWYCDARACVDGSAEAFTWTAEEILPLYLGEERAAKEIARAKHDLDAMVYAQEMLASFVVYSGLVYYSFAPEDHVSDGVNYDPSLDLILCFDFNVEPGVAAVVQEDRTNDVTRVIGEVCIPKDSNTPRVCRKIVEDWSHHQGIVRCYGDATGGARGTAKVQGSDWDLIRAELKQHFPGRLRIIVPKENPAERARVNAMNSRLRGADGSVKVVVDKRCRTMVRDLEGVRVLEGSAGEIDKKSDSRLTHITDALGYYIARRFPVGAARGLHKQAVI